MFSLGAHAALVAGCKNGKVLSTFFCAAQVNCLVVARNTSEMLVLLTPWKCRDMRRTGGEVGKVYQGICSNNHNFFSRVFCRCMSVENRSTFFLSVRTMHHLSVELGWDKVDAGLVKCFPLLASHRRKFVFIYPLSAPAAVVRTYNTYEAFCDDS